MSAIRVVEVPLVGPLTGSEIRRRGGWPTEGVGLERIARIRAALDAMKATPDWGNRDFEARFRRLQELEGMAHSIRHARQCTRLGHPAEAARHLALVFPQEHLRYAIWRAFGRNQLSAGTLNAVLRSISGAKERSFWLPHRDAVPEPLRGRIEAYLTSLVR